MVRHSRRRVPLESTARVRSSSTSMSMGERSVLYVQVESNTLPGSGIFGGGGGTISAAFGVLGDTVVDLFELSLALHPWSVHLQLTGLTLMDLGIVDTEIAGVSLPWTDVLPGVGRITGSAGTWLGPLGS